MCGSAHLPMYLTELIIVFTVNKPLKYIKKIIFKIKQFVESNFSGHRVVWLLNRYKHLQEEHYFSGRFINYL